LVVIEQKQLSILENEQNISLVKDDRSCKVLASQQLQQAEAQAKEQKQEVTDEIRRSFYDNTYLACMELTGRDSRLFQVTRDSKNDEKIEKEI
jgi:hypothetical protein